MDFVCLRVGVKIKKTICLSRSPIFLRFVMVGTDWETLDALDQVTDTPRENERVLAAVKSDESTVHIDRVLNGRRCGEWRRMVTYELVKEQPSQELLRDSTQWQQWVQEEWKRMKEQLPATDSATTTPGGASDE